MTSAPDRERGHLLIVDDEPDICAALRRQFRRRYRVHIAGGGDEALRLMEAHPVAVVISDQRMPGMTGAELYERVRVEYPQAVRLLLTGYSDIGSVIAAINLGHVHRYITKPWDPVELDVLVAQAFERYALIHENHVLLDRLKAANEQLEQRVRDRTAALEAANHRLEALNAEKDAFLGMAAHDLRNPLGVVQGLARLLKAGVAVTAEEAAVFLQEIDDTVGTMLRLVEDLLDVSVIERGHLSLALVETTAAALVAPVAARARAAGAAKGNALALDVDPSLSMTRCDIDRLRQVLENLLSNAFKYSRSGTRVTLRAAAVGAAARFTVEDQGLGIPADELEGVFESFHKTSTRPTSGESSTGLGLAICKHIVEAHGGRVGARSAVGEGSVFWFELPL